MLKQICIWFKSWQRTYEYVGVYLEIRRRVRSRLIARGLMKKNASKKMEIAASYINFVVSVAADVGGVEAGRFLKSEMVDIWTDFYSTILIFDDEIDLAEGSDRESKRSNLARFFRMLHRAMEDVDVFMASIDGTNPREVRLGDFISSWQGRWCSAHVEKLRSSLLQMENEWINESLADSSGQALSSLELVPQASVDILVATVEIFFNVEIPKENRAPIYSICFAGNVLDDFVDYFITKEDVGKVCYIELRKLELSGWGWSAPGIALSEIYLAAIWHLAKTHFRSRSSNACGWVIPMANRFIFLIGPLNLLTAFTHRSLIRSTLEADLGSSDKSITANARS